MGITTAVILAGGKGTRLGEITATKPKPLVDVAGRPFIFYVLDFLSDSGIRNVILSVGYLAEQFNQVLGNTYANMSLTYQIENAPLGTGGAIFKCIHSSMSPYIVVNGDTLFKAKLDTLIQVHKANYSKLTMALRHVPDVSRYGSIKLQADKIISIEEKGGSGAGLINGGIYVIEPNIFDLCELPEAFSFERDFLPAAIERGVVHGCIDDSYFRDIGIPTDLALADRELRG